MFCFLKYTITFTDNLYTFNGPHFVEIADNIEVCQQNFSQRLKRKCEYKVKCGTGTSESAYFTLKSFYIYI